MTTRILLSLVLFVSLVACGDDGYGRYGTGLPADFDANAPDAAEKAAEYTMAAGLAFELNDDAMDGFLAAHRRVLAAGHNPRSVMAAASGGGWNWMKYGKAMMKWKAMQEAVKRGPDGAQRDIDEMNEQGEKLETQLAEASGAERARLKTMLEQHERVRGAYVKAMEAVKKLATPEVRVLVRKWEPRFEALEAEFDD